jgi:S1-C subfamily serine protease
LFRRLSEDYKTTIDISEVKILLEDGTELPAAIVLRDKDLDLAFIRPKTKPTTPMAAVDLTKSGPAQILDQVITLNRLKRGAGRAFSASVEVISAVVQKPRTFYVPDSAPTETGIGSPAFNLDGTVLGIFVRRAVNSQGASNWRDCISTVILPAEDIAKAAAQAPADVKPDEASTEAPKDSAAPATNAPAADAPKEPAK